MSIKNVRLNEVFNKTIADAIKDGYLPSSRHVLFKIRDYMFDNDLNKPYFKYKHINKKDITNSIDYNLRLDNLYKDISILYERLNFNSSTLDQKKDELIIKKKKLVDEIRKIRDEVETLIAKFNNKGITDVLFDNFRDLSKTDTTVTTAAVDKGVTIKNLVTNSKKIIEKPITTVTYLGDNKNVVKYGSTDELFNEESKNPWTCVIRSDYEAETGFQFVLDFSAHRTAQYSSMPNRNGVLLNRIAIDTTIDSKVKLEYTYDNENIFEIPYSNGLQPIKAVYNFPEILATKVYITFLKDKADSLTSDNLFEYLFNIKSILFYNYDYMDSAVIQSVTLTSEKNINKVSLSVDDETPETTSIEYYLSIEDEWVRVDTLEDTTPKFQQVVDLMNVEASMPIIYNIPSSESKISHELTNLRYNGIAFYRLGSVEHDITSSLLMRGKNAIRIGSSYKALDATQPSLLYTGNDADIEFYIYCAQSFSFDTYPSTTMTSTIKLNDEVLFNSGIPTGGTALAFQLKKGWNKVNINVKGSGSFDIGYDLKRAGNIYAENKAMEKVDIFDLQRVVKINDNDKYAIYNNYVVVNNYIPDIEYELVYDYASKEVHDIKFKAVLNRNGSHVTPKINSYYINII